MGSKPLLKYGWSAGNGLAIAIFSKRRGADSSQTPAKETVLRSVVISSVRNNLLILQQ
jgi:hypothetical protein